MQNDRGNVPPAGRPHPGLVAAAAGAGAALGLALAASRSGSVAGGCAAAARHLGACVPGTLAAAKPYVTAGLIGMLLAALIAIAAVLVWRDVLAAFESVGRREPARRRASVVPDGRRPRAAGSPPAFGTDRRPRRGVRNEELRSG